MMWLILGHLSVTIGVIGIFLPILPTTPFLLLASFFYSKGSKKFELWLLNHPTLGPSVKAWRESGAIPIKVKIVATITICISILFVASRPDIPDYAKGSMIVVVAGALVYILSRPSQSNPHSHF